MCGIAGILSLHGSTLDPTAVKDMCDSLVHRGPDDAGYACFDHRGEWHLFVDPEFAREGDGVSVYGGESYRTARANGSFECVLGHRRLSILDLSSAGRQPMTFGDQRYWIVYNGEIYNFPELRAELRSAGHTFSTGTDTEVLLKLWVEQKEACLSRLNGMFAFAVYDRLERRLTLARDRFGVKPLYYAVTGEHVAFASEVKGVLASGIVKPRINPDALAEYFTFQNVYSNRTLFEDVLTLMPGEFLTVRVGGGNGDAARRYHDGYPDADPALYEHENLAEEVAEVFGRAVKRQLVSDVDVGSYLSGGMDSGSIVSVAGRHIDRLTTFTGGFDLTNVNGIEQGFDERREAEQLSWLLQTEHYAVVLHAGDMPAAMERISWHMDDPRVGMCHQNWYVAKLAGKFVKVCLAGAGGDELFGGYPWRYRRGFGARDARQFDDAYFRYWHRLLSPDELPGLFAPDVRGHLQGVRKGFDALLTDAPRWDEGVDAVDNILRRSLYFEFRTFLPGFLTTEDRMSMAHSLETRVPFLDNELADLAWRIPDRLKLDVNALSSADKKGHIRTAEGKLILREAMERYLPSDFTQMPKQGFSPPDENWFRGPSMDYIKSVLYDERTLDRGWFDTNFMRDRLEEHFSGRRNHRLLIWSLLSFEWLQRHFVDAA